MKYMLEQKYKASTINKGVCSAIADLHKMHELDTPTRTRDFLAVLLGFTATMRPSDYFFFDVKRPTKSLSFD